MPLYSFSRFFLALTMLAPLSAALGQIVESKAVVEPPVSQTVEVKPSAEPSLSTNEIGIPRLLRISGTLKTSNNSDSSMVALSFSIYKDQIGGMPLWSEIQNVAMKPDGSFTAFLGGGTAVGLPVELFSGGEARWLGVRLIGQEEQSRIMFVSVPYALKASDAETLGGKPASAYVTADQIPAVVATRPELQLTPNSEATGAPTKGRVGPKQPTSAAAINGGGSQNFVTKFTDNIGDVGNSDIFDVNGNVGINTTTPNAPLEINGEVRISAIAGSNAGLDILSNGQGSNSVTLKQGFNTATDNIGFLYNRANADFVLGTNNLERMRIQAGGNVGIQTTTPNAPLEVNGEVRISAIAGSNAGLDILSNGQGSNFVTLKQGFNTATDNIGFLYNRANADFVLGTNNLERMRIQAGGNVGIGTITPSQKLEVNGGIKLSAGSGGGLTFADGTTQTTATLVGPQGPKGDTGATGPPGPPGPGSTSAVCITSASVSAAFCSCSIRLVSQTMINSTPGGTCTATANTGSCSASAFNSPNQQSATCCVCAPN